MPSFNDITGKTFNRLTVISRAENIGRCTAWNCVCSCGNKTVTRSKAIVSGGAKSCGCLQKEVAVALARRMGIKCGKDSGGYKHGDACRGKRTAENSIWAAMRDRCNNPANNNFMHYGARGITVCERWNLFENFIADMGCRPSNKHSIERINNNGNYCAENCKWATRVEQANNTRRNHILIFQGVSDTVAGWANKLGISYTSLNNRIHRGWSTERAITTPVIPRK